MTVIPDQQLLRFKSSTAQNLTAICLLLLLGLLILNAVYLFENANAALVYPFDLNYGEGIVWQQMRDIVAGHGYSPLGVYPAIVYHYPPFYHLTTAFTASIFGLDQLMAGRLVSQTSTFLMAMLVGLLSAELIGRSEPRGVRLVCGTIAGLILLSCVPVIAWSSLMRVDMLCGALALAGLALVIRSVNRPFSAICAGILFTLAIYTKQTSVAAPAAGFIVLAYIAPRQAMTLLFTCLILGLVVLIWLSWSTHGGFLEHTLRYNVNRLDLSRGVGVLKQLWQHLFFIGAALVGLVVANQRLSDVKRTLANTKDRKAFLRDDRASLATLVISTYLIFCTLMMPMMLKSGSDINYLIEWLCAISIFAAFGAKPIVAFVLGGEKKTSLALCCLYFVGLPSTIWGIARIYGDAYSEQARHKPGELEKIVDLIHRSPKPVISDDMVLLIRAGRPVTWEPAITAELGHAGIYDERKFAAMVRHREFGFFVTRSQRGHRPFDDRYNPIVADAMDEAYPRKVFFSGLVLHLPLSNSGRRNRHLPPVAPPQQAQP